METQLREFLGPFPLPQTVAHSSDRFEKRLTTLYDRLIDLGFAFDDIQQAAVQLGYHMTLELALDWLCWHVDALPARFTDARSDSPKDNLSVWVEPIGTKFDASLEEHAIHQMDHFLPNAVYKKPENENRIGEEKDVMSNAQKEWLLAQYQYEQDDEGDAYGEENEGEDEAVENFISVSDDRVPGTTLQVNDDITRQDTIKLQNLKAELQSLESQLNDEASCYMMSKHELKAMRNQVKPLKNQVKVLEAKIAGRERKAALQCKADIVSNALLVGHTNEDTDGECVSDIFSDGDKKIDIPVERSLGSKTKEGSGEQVTIAVPTDSVPKSWTGIKPKALLEDCCRRYKFPQPSFQRVTKTSCKLRIKTSTGGEGTEIHQDGPTLADAQHFAATRALFQLDPTANIHLILPPFHRDAWLEWKSAAQAMENDLKKNQGAKRQSEIDLLLRLISQVDVGRHIGVRTAASELDGVSSMATYTNDSWQEVGEPRHAPNITQDDIKLKKYSETLQSTEEYQVLLQSREKLPVYAFRDTILEAIDKNPVLIISAETGAGKTTQVCTV